MKSTLLILSVVVGLLALNEVEAFAFVPATKVASSAGTKVVGVKKKIAKVPPAIKVKPSAVKKGVAIQKKKAAKSPPAAKKKLVKKSPPAAKSKPVKKSPPVAKSKPVKKSPPAAQKKVSKKLSVPKVSTFERVKVPSKNAGPKQISKGTSAVINPISFGLNVINSPKGKEATGILIDGGLKLVSALLEEGKKSKVTLPGGFDKGGKLVYAEKYIGLRELLDGAVFAGGELLETGGRAIEKISKPPKSANYLNATNKTKTIKKVVNKQGKVIKPETSVYYVNIGGKRTKVQREL